jgi:hypothetical protein
MKTKHKFINSFDEMLNDKESRIAYHIYLAEIAIKELNKVSKIKYELKEKKH